MGEIKEIGTIVVGFGFSCIPLIRELELSGEPYLIISDKKPGSIWAKLDDSDRLNFDLVSSYYTSFYSFDLVNDPKEDLYPLAKDFYEMHLAHYKKYEHKVVRARVNKIQNYNGFSLVHLDNGSYYEATNVVITVGFERKIIKQLDTFDYNTSNKTIVFDNIGDSTNLMISKLIAGNNKLICVTDGFVSLDKLFLSSKKVATTLDQFEYHNLGLIRKELYRDTILGSPYVFNLMFFTGWRYKLALALGKLLFPSVLFYSHPETVRHTKVEPKRYFSAAPVANGLIAIKNWPIDVYAKLFGNNLEDAMKKGYLLNDAALWIELGMIHIYKKNATTIDMQKQTISYKGETLAYDHFVEVNPEIPRLPPILNYTADGEASEYNYVPKENYFGAVPMKLSNIFIIGNTRPTTGGLANLTEMQCLLAHKMIVNDAFKNEIYSSIKERIASYNQKYYLNDLIGKADHVTYYGFFNEELARVLGIDLKLRDCKSWREISQWFFFPNNAFKYRQRGEYKVEGCDRLVELIDQRHRRWPELKLFGLTLRLYHLMLFIMIGRMYSAGLINLAVVTLLLAIQYSLRHIIVGYTLYSQSPVQDEPRYRTIRTCLVITSTIATCFIKPSLFLLVLGLEIASTILVRAFKPELAKLPFNDFRVKKVYLNFLIRYLQTYKRLFINNPIPCNISTNTKKEKLEEIVT